METNILNSDSKKIFNYMTSNATAVVEKLIFKMILVHLLIFLFINVNF